VSSEPAHPTRRAFVLGGVGVAALTLGASGTDVLSTLTTTPPLPLVVPATEDLMTDHGLLKRILLIYRECGRRLTTGDQLDPAALFHSAQMVHDYIEGFHEGIEEGYIFPRLQRAGKLTDTVRTLLTQHDRGRKLTIAIIQASTTMSMNGRGAAPGFNTAHSRAQLANTLSTFITSSRLKRWISSRSQIRLGPTPVSSPRAAAMATTVSGRASQPGAPPRSSLANALVFPPRVSRACLLIADAVVDDEGPMS